MIEENELPESWVIKSLEEVANIVYGDSLREDERNSDGNIPVYASGGIIDYHDKKSANPPAVILGRKGSINNVQFVDSEFATIDTVFYVKPDSELNAKYLYYYLDFYDLETLDASSTLPSLRKGDLQDIDIPVPPLDEQERIVEAVEERLERVERLENSVANVGRLADEYESSMVNYLFYNRKKDKKFEDWNSPHKQLPEDWDIRTLGEIGSFRNGKYLPKKDMIEDAEYPVFGSNGLIGRYNESWVSNPVIAIGRVGSCGEVNRVRDEAWITDNAIVFWPDENVSFEYVYKFLEEYNFEPLIREASQPLIRQGDVKDIRIPIPPLKKQEDIVREVNSTDFSVISKSVDDLDNHFNEYKDSVLAHAFQGDIDY